MIHVDAALLDPSPLAAPAPARALIEGQLAMLTRLAQIGMEIAEAAGHEARAAAATARRARRGRGPRARTDPRPGLVFARVARAVRMTIALQSRLLKDLADLDRADERAAARPQDRAPACACPACSTRPPRRPSRRSASPAPGAGRTRRPSRTRSRQLSSEAYERLTDAEDGDLVGRPFDEVVAGVGEDLGLSPDWTVRLMAAVEPPRARCADAAPPPSRPPLSRGKARADLPP